MGRGMTAFLRSLRFRFSRDAEITALRATIATLTAMLAGSETKNAVHVASIIHLQQHFAMVLEERNQKTAELAAIRAELELAREKLTRIAPEAAYSH
jgi:hypothetical protein